MAGERKGKTYEAILKVALDKLKSDRFFVGHVFWNQTPTGMTIEPDFVVGKTLDSPTHMILVSHSGSAKNSDMKFWRNLGELAEAKLFLSSTPRVFNLAFDSVYKADLKTIQAAAFDGQLIVGDASYGQDLQGWVESHHASLASNATDKVLQLTELVESDSTFNKLFSSLVTDLRVMLGKNQPELDQLWNLERTRPKGEVRLPKKTHLRRGVGKLMLLDSPTDVDSQGRLAKTLAKDATEALKRLELAKPTISGLKVTDSEMLWALRNIGKEDLQQLCKCREQTRVKEWIDALRSLASVEKQLEYVHKYWKDMLESSELFGLLKECHLDPSAIDKLIISATSKRVWLFHLLVEWIKLSGKTRTGFGLAQLVQDIAKLSKDAGHRKSVEGMLGRKASWHGKHTLMLGLTDWHSAPSKQMFAFTDDDLARIADALSRRLKSCKRPDPKSDLQQLIDAIVQTNLEAKLLTYRNFKPIEQLLVGALKRAGKKWELISKTRACFTERAVANGASIDPRSSSTTVMRVGHTLINWQSASDAGRDHKKKELCGRAVALRYSWNDSSKTFTPRVGVKKLILVVDGTWRQEDLNSLVRSGWDQILYPDEMDMVVAGIV